MSIFASQTQSDPIPIPWDPPHTIVVRKLTGREVDAAQAADMAGVLNGGARTWAERFKRMAQTGDPKAMAELFDPLVGYDRFSLVRAGLVSWTYPQPIKPVKAKAAVAAKGQAPAQPAVEASDAIEDLDDEAVDFIATEVLRLTKPALFLTPETAEDEQKKADGPSPIA